VVIPSTDIRALQVQQRHPGNACSQKTLSCRQVAEFPARSQDLALNLALNLALRAQEEAPNAVEAVTHPEGETEASHPKLDSDAPTVRAYLFLYAVHHAC